MVRGIADFEFISVAERVGCVWIFPVDVVDMTDVTVHPFDIASPRMARIDIPVKQLLAGFFAAI